MDAKTKAGINLHAVLRNLQELCEVDEAASAIVKGKKIAVKFTVKGCDPMSLTFEDGKCAYARGGEASGELRLKFSKPEKFNKLIDGGSVVPGFNITGITKLGFMTKDFMKISERLEYYLRPKDPSLLEDKEFFRINTVFTAYTAFHALAEIGNLDPVGQAIAHRIPDGKIAIEIKETGDALTISVSDGRMSAAIGKAENPNALMEFGNLDVVHRVLNGKTDVYSAMGEGLFAVSGLIPMLDNMSKLLGLVSRYLA